MAALSVNNAMARLDVIPDYDAGNGPESCVHTFAQSAGGMLLGAHWDVGSVREFFQAHGVEEAGKAATASGHGLVAMGDGRTIFFATRAEEADHGCS